MTERNVFETYFGTTSDSDDYKRIGKVNPAMRKQFAAEKKEIKDKLTLLKKDVTIKRTDLKHAVERVEKVKKVVATFNTPRVQTESQKIAAKKKADALIVKSKLEAARIIAKATKAGIANAKKEKRIFDRELMKKLKVVKKVQDKNDNAKEKKVRTKLSEEQKLARSQKKSNELKLLMAQLG